MKFKIHYSSRRIFKQNLPLFLTLLALSVVALAVVVLNVQQFKVNQEKMAALEREINTYKEKQNLLTYKNQVIDTKLDLDQANLVLSQLVPTKEDYFSVLAALENLSAKTNFIITAYNIIVSESTDQKLAIVIDGEGDPNVFLEFLKEYNFSGGRLITVDKIEFSQDAAKGIKVNLNVYSGKVSTTVNLTTPVPSNIELISSIMQKVEIQFKDEQSLVEDYPTKQNPF